jgi:hypothetical protein
MNRFRIFVTLVLLACMSRSALATDVAVLPVTGTNLQPGEREAIGQVLADAYAPQASCSVMGPREISRRLSATSRPASLTPADLAQMLGVKEYIHTSAVRLGYSMTLRCSRHLADGTLLHQVKATAYTLDDMEQVAERIARALFERTSLEQTRTLYNITRREGRGRNRLFSEKVWGLKTETSFPVAVGQSIAPSMSIGFDGRLEGESYFIEFGAGFTVPTSFDDDDKDSIGGLYTEFGGSYYLANKNISPYIGLGVSPRIYGGFDDGGARIGLWGQIGVMFFRMSSTRLYVDARVTQNVVPYKKTEYPDGTWNTPSDSEPDAESIYPTEFALAVGIGW